MIPSKEEIKISAAIIAGGANKRFNGKTKANIQISGVRIITRAIKTLYEIFNDIIIVTNTPDEFKTCQQFTIVPDKIKNVGPLGGIHAAISAAKNEAVFVFASDMPCLSGDLIRQHIEFYMKHKCDAAIPAIKKSIEPLHAIYNKRIEDQLFDFLGTADKYSIQCFLDQINTKYNKLADTDQNRKAFININTPEELSNIELLAESGYK